MQLVVASCHSYTCAARRHSTGLPHTPPKDATHCYDGSATRGCTGALDVPRSEHEALGIFVHDVHRRWGSVFWRSWAHVIRGRLPAIGRPNAEILHHGPPPAYAASATGARPSQQARRCLRPSRPSVSVAPSRTKLDSGSHKVHPLCEKQPRTGGYPADKIKSFP